MQALLPARATLLVITKQGDANVIETVDRIRELIPEIKRWIPADIDISVLSDRTQTIRASVHDMQLTLVATIILVMFVVFALLRRVEEFALSPARASIRSSW